MRRQVTLPRLSSHPRLRITTYMFSLIVLLCLLAACGGPTDQTPPTPTPAPPTAQQLIANAQTAIKKVTAYHFKLDVQNPGVGGTFVILNADGDIVVPDKLKATAKVNVLGSAVNVQIIAIGNQDYITDPISQKWTKTTGIIDPRTLSDPQMGVASILGHIQDPTAPTDGNVDGTPCWSINGTLDPLYLAGITGGVPANSPKLTLNACIGKSDNLPYLIKVTGIAGQSDTANTVRTFKLSNFGENVAITAPI